MKPLPILFTTIPLVVIAVSYSTPLIARGYFSPFVPIWASLFLVYIALPMFAYDIGQLFPTPAFVLSFVLLAGGGYFAFLYSSVKGLNVPLAGVGEAWLVFVLILNGLAWFGGAKTGMAQRAKQSKAQ